MSLSSNVLVLNKFYLAIRVCNVEDSITNLVVGRCEVINRNYETFNLEQWNSESIKILNNDEIINYCGVVRSPSMVLVQPQVIIMKEAIFNKARRGSVSFTRENVFQRDNKTCQYCNKKLTSRECTIDHVIPKSRCGTNTWSNMVTSCKSCNAKKQNYLLEEINMKLINNPTKPKWESFINKKFENIKNSYWDIFLGQE